MHIQYRKRHLHAALGASLLALLVAIAGPAVADDDDNDVTVVYPTGIPAQDIGNIRDAVAMAAEGGTVLLRATAFDGTPTPFNFGQVFPETLEEAFAQREFNSVNITKSVRIHGESLGDIWDDDDDDEEVSGDAIRTTVEGGLEPFRVLAPGIDVVIEGIDFTCNRYKVIQVIAGRHVVIRNNRFGKVTFFATDLLFGTPRTFGIAVVSDTGEEQISVDKLEIVNNVLDLNPDPSPRCPLPGEAFDPDPSREDLGNKLTFVIFTANLEGNKIIAGNRVQNTGFRGISVIDNFGTAIVRSNILELGPLAVANGNGGISAQNGIFPPFDRAAGRFAIMKNRITCSHPNCTGIGVGDTTVPRAGRANVRRNHVTMAVPASDAPTSPIAAGLDILISNSVFSFNRIVGRSNFAIALTGEIDFDGPGPAPPVTGLADNNRIVLNDVTDFDAFDVFNPSEADYVLFDANHNFLLGRSGTVFDAGEGNVIRGGLEVVGGGS